MPAHTDDWVLLISSDENHRTSWRSLLNQEGYHVLEAPNAIQALHELRRSPHALTVLLDHPQLSMLNAIMPDRRVARHHSYLVFCAQDDRCHPRAQALLEQLALRVLPYPVAAATLLDAVAHASHNLTAHALYT